MVWTYCKNWWQTHHQASILWKLELPCENRIWSFIQTIRTGNSWYKTMSHEEWFCVIPCISPYKWAAAFLLFYVDFFVLRNCRNNCWSKLVVTFKWFKLIQKFWCTKYHITVAFVWWREKTNWQQVGGKTPQKDVSFVDEELNILKNLILLYLISWILNLDNGNCTISSFLVANSNALEIS